MAKDFHIEWEGLDELDRMLDDLSGDNLERILLEEYTDFAMFAEEAIRSLIPRDGSDLEGSYVVGRPVISGKEISIEGGSNSEYALRRHEEPYRKGEHPKYDDGSKYPGYYVDGRGARTRNKPGFRGEEAGRKYQERAVNLIEEDFHKMNKRVIDRLAGRRGR